MSFMFDLWRKPLTYFSHWHFITFDCIEDTTPQMANELAALVVIDTDRTTQKR